MKLPNDDLWLTDLNFVLLKALKIANPGSCVFFFTDADAKDPEKQNDVINLVNAKHFKLVYFLRGDCAGGGRRRRSEFTVQNPTCILNGNSRRAGLFVVCLTGTLTLIR